MNIKDFKHLLGATVVGFVDRGDRRGDRLGVYLAPRFGGELLELEVPPGAVSPPLLPEPKVEAPAPTAPLAPYRPRKSVVLVAEHVTGEKCQLEFDRVRDAKKAAKKLGVTAATFYRRKREYRSANEVSRWRVEVLNRDPGDLPFDDHLRTLNFAASALGIPTTAVMMLEGSGRLECVRQGRCVYFRDSVLVKALRSGIVAPREDG